MSTPDEQLAVTTTSSKMDENKSSEKLFVTTTSSSGSSSKIDENKNSEQLATTPTSSKIDENKTHSDSSSSSSEDSADGEDQKRVLIEIEPETDEDVNNTTTAAEAKPTEPVIAEVVVAEDQDETGTISKTIVSKTAEESPEEEAVITKVVQKKASNKKTPPGAGGKKKAHGALVGRKIKPKNYPKRPLSAYNAFFKDIRHTIVVGIKEQNKRDQEAGTADAAKSSKDIRVDNFQAMVKEIARQWKALPAEKRERFEKLSHTDTIRYREEVRQYENDAVERSHREELVHEENQRKARETREQDEAAAAKNVAIEEQKRRVALAATIPPPPPRNATARGSLEQHVDFRQQDHQLHDHQRHYSQRNNSHLAGNHRGEARRDPGASAAEIDELRRILEVDLMQIEGVRELKLRQLAELQAGIVPRSLLSAVGSSFGDYHENGNRGLPSQLESPLSSHAAAGVGVGRGGIAIEAELELLKRQRRQQGASSLSASDLLSPGGAGSSATSRSHLLSQLGLLGTGGAAAAGLGEQLGGSGRGAYHDHLAALLSSQEQQEQEYMLLVRQQQEEEAVLRGLQEQRKRDLMASSSSYYPPPQGRGVDPQQGELDGYLHQQHRQIQEEAEEFLRRRRDGAAQLDEYYHEQLRKRQQEDMASRGITSDHDRGAIDRAPAPRGGPSSLYLGGAPPPGAPAPATATSMHPSTFYPHGANDFENDRKRRRFAEEEEDGIGYTGNPESTRAPRGRGAALPPSANNSNVRGRYYDY